MRLDRNIPGQNGRGKYALVNLRNQRRADRDEDGIIQWVDDCGPGEEHEFFVIMLKDKHAATALRAYYASIHGDDPEFAAEVLELVDRAGPNSPFCQDPD